jgi:hypothetical protein
MEGGHIRKGYIYKQETDWSSEAGARTQADQFRDYWKRRGVDVETTIVCMGSTDNPVWGFRSNFKPVGGKSWR